MIAPPSFAAVAAVATTLASAAGDANAIVAPSSRHASSSACSGELAGRGDVAVGERRGNAERRPVERERSECGDEPVVVGDLVRRGQRIALGGELTVPVPDALGRAGGARREQDRPQVRRDRARAGARQTPRGSAISVRHVDVLRSRCPAQQRRGPDPARRGPMVQRGRVDATARPSPRSPSPRSATTVTPPARHTPYTATSRSMPGGVNIATRSPATRPAPAQPGGDRLDALRERREVDASRDSPGRRRPSRRRRSDDAGHRTPTS